MHFPTTQTNLTAIIFLYFKIGCPCCILEKSEWNRFVYVSVIVFVLVILTWKLHDCIDNSTMEIYLYLRSYYYSFIWFIRYFRNVQFIVFITYFQFDILRLLYLPIYFLLSSYFSSNSATIYLLNCAFPYLNWEMENKNRINYTILWITMRIKKK